MRHTVSKVCRRIAESGSLIIVIQVIENFKEFMFMDIYRRVAVMLAKHDISCKILKYIIFFQIRKPGFLAKNRNIQPVAGSGNEHSQEPAVRKKL